MAFRNPFQNLSIPFFSPQYWNGTPKTVILSPFQKAGQVWDKRMGEPVARAAQWRGTTFAIIGILGAQTGLEYYREFNRPLPAYAVPKDANGMLAGTPVFMPDARYVPTRAQVAADISQWLILVRSRPADGYTMRQNHLRAEKFMGRDAVVAFNEYKEKEAIFQDHKTSKDQSSRVTVSVTGPDDDGSDPTILTVPDVVPLEGNSYQARWREVRWEYGVPGKPYLMTGIFRAKGDGQNKPEDMTINPAGTTITWWEWRGAPAS